jgi:pimeloyl-ACP methyl ester carboxylesterase
MDSFSYQDYQIKYRLSGQGKPVLLLHGFLENSTIWDTILPFFDESEFQLITVDLPCHGQSRYVGEKCSMREMADAVEALLRSIGITKLSCIGHSMGGYVALELAKQIELKVILLHSNFWEDSEQKKEDRNRVIEVVKQNKNRFINEAIPNLFASQNKEKCSKDIERLIIQASAIPSAEIIAATVGMRDRSSFVKNMDKMDVSIIHGELDPIIPTNQMEESINKLEKLPPLIQLKNCGHMSIWESKTDLIKAIKSLLIQ